MPNILLIGHHSSVARLLSLPSSSRLHTVYLLEEPSIARETISPCHADQPHLGGIVAIRPGKYQQTHQHLETVTDWHNSVGFDAVIPGREFGVRAAQAAAKQLRLPFTSDSAVDVCTDKYRLRELCAAADIPQGKFGQVSDAEGVAEFVRKIGKSVLKPANRHGSLGVVAVSSPENATEAWGVATEDLGPWALPDRSLDWTYLIEEWLDGPQVSIETIVWEKEAIFHNVSLMEFEPEKSMLEVAVTVPAPLSDGVYRDLIKAKEAFLRTAGANRGIFHSEWKLTPNGPRLIECASRMPGGLRPEQILWSWGLNICEAFVDVMSGRRPEVPSHPHSISLVRTLYPSPGVVRGITGLRLLEETPTVVHFTNRLSIGDSFDRHPDAWGPTVQYMAVCQSEAELASTRALLDAEVAIHSK